MTRRDDDFCECRQRRAKAGEDRLKLWNKKYEQENHHAQGKHHQDGRVKHRGQHFAAQVFFTRLKVCDLREHEIEKAARLACLHHRCINTRESFR